MPEKITFDDVAGVLTQSVTVNQVDDEGNPVVREVRIDHYGEAVQRVRRDPEFDSKISASVKRKIDDREAALQAESEAAALVNKGEM